MNKLLRIPPVLWERIEKCINKKGLTFTEFVKMVFDEYLSREGY